MGRSRDLADGTLAELNVDSNTLAVDATNNRVGIGTASPSSTFHVSGGAGSTIRNTASSGSSWIVGTNVDSYILHNESNTPMVFTTNGTERMRIDSSGNVGINNSNPDQYISSADTVLNITGSAVNTSPATLSMNGSSTILGRDFATTQVFGVNVSNTATEITRITGTSSNGFRMMVRITTSGHTGGVGNSSIYAMYYWDGGTGTPQQIFRYDSGASLGLSFDNSTSNVFIIKLASAGAAGSYQGTFMVEWFVPQDFAGGTWTIS